MTAPDAPPPLPPARTDTYSAQIAVADVGGLLGSIVLAGATKETGLVLLAPLAAPAVHVFHGHPGRAVGSLMLNVGLPIAGAYVGYGIESANCGPDTWFCGLGGLVLGGLAGIATAIVVDSAVLARIPEETDAPGARVTASHGVTPLLAMNRDGSVSLGVGGRF